MLSSPPVLAKVQPPERALGLWPLIAAVVRNPMEAWPAQIYEQPTYRSSFFGRETLFISDPDLIHFVLVERPDAFNKSEAMRRALGPALGNGLLTAEGPDWRWQRRALAPIFQHDKILSFVPRMSGAALKCLDRLGDCSEGQLVNVQSHMISDHLRNHNRYHAFGRKGIRRV